MIYIPGPNIGALVFLRGRQAELEGKCQSPSRASKIEAKVAAMHAAETDHGHIEPDQAQVRTSYADWWRCCAVDKIAS